MERRTFVIRSGLAWLLLATVAGCGPSSFGDFRNQLVERSCARLIRCGRLAASEKAYCPVPSELAGIVAPAGDLDIDAAASRSWLAFHSDHAQSCLDAVSGAACDDAEAARTVLLACNNVIAPNVPVGQRCPEVGSCVGGVCANASVCGGSCLPYPSPGASCISDGGVSDAGPRDCDPTIEYCNGGVCAYHQEGGQKCVADGDCAFGLSCNSNGKCGNPPRVADGSSCDATHLCEGGNACVGGVCQAELSSGELCSSTAPCRDGLVCRTNISDGGTQNLCNAASDVGGACVASSAQSGCASDDICQPADGGAGSCHTPAGGLAGPGQECDGNVMCAAGLYCRNNQCLFLGGRGAACTSADQCRNGLVCNSEQRCDRAGCEDSISADAGTAGL